ncbi:hypothetical protein HELRODRAFT_170253 [Helobdella robusta]|uniref:Uncharacterized protein n=1 Tax=Helobdella robusta TaxID=6412 RepID=T1F2U1_HELRO|nr:hypothetical protein HELRODRAFT_170253 [Helobdella robusta]ESO07712.1 hypothetical protein HELRODRAFT_170253 [Helobdella robusta]
MEPSIFLSKIMNVNKEEASSDLHGKLQLVDTKTHQLPVSEGKIDDFSLVSCFNKVAKSQDNKESKYLFDTLDKNNFEDNKRVVNSNSTPAEQQKPHSEDWHEFQKFQGKTSEVANQHLNSQTSPLNGSNNTEPLISASLTSNSFNVIFSREICRTTEQTDPNILKNFTLNCKDTKVWQDLEYSRTKSKLKFNWNESIFKKYFLKSMHLETPFSVIQFFNLYVYLLYY